MNDDIQRISDALALAAEVLVEYTPGDVASEAKVGGSPVTEADLRVDAVLRQALPRDGEGWLSEETVDDRSRLGARRVWVVDPIDGTKEFIRGVPEWCVSVGLVVDGVPMVGGILNPSHDELILGAVGQGVTLNGSPVAPTDRTELAGALVLASRSEIRRGEWDPYEDAGFEVRPVGSVAYKLALVAAGRADATWTLTPKNEWDVAGGVALLRAGGGGAWTPEGAELKFNQPDPLYRGLVATGAGLREPVRALLSRAP